MNDSRDPDQAPKVTEHLVEAGLRAVFAAGAHKPRAPLQTCDEDVPGQVGRYEVTGIIGRGGVGVVVKGRDADLRREIAIKLLLGAHQGSARMKERFLEEAQVAGQLEHPGIVSVHEVGLPVTFEFEDGSIERRRLPCDDWYHDLPPARRGRLRPGLVPVWNGMDRMHRGKLEEAREPALFEALIPLPVEKVLASLVLEPAGATFDGPRTRMSIFAVTGMRRSEAR